MRHMVWTIEVLSIPACWKAERRHDAFCTDTFGECEGFVVARAEVVEAGECELAESSCICKTSGLDVADKHSEALKTCYQNGPYQDSISEEEWQVLTGWKA